MSRSRFKVADEASTPLTSINSGQAIFSYSVEAVTYVVTWSVCDGRTSGEAGAASQTDSRDVEREARAVRTWLTIELNCILLYIVIFYVF